MKPNNVFCAPSDKSRTTSLGSFPWLHRIVNGLPLVSSAFEVPALRRNVEIYQRLPSFGVDSF